MTLRAPHLPRLPHVLGLGIPLALALGATCMATVAPLVPDLPRGLQALGVAGGLLPLAGGLLAYPLLRRLGVVAPQARAGTWAGWGTYYAIFYLGLMGGYALYGRLLTNAFQLPTDALALVSWYVTSPAVGALVLVWLEGEAAFRAEAAAQEAALAGRIEALLLSREVLAYTGSRGLLAAASLQAEAMVPQFAAIAATLRSEPAAGPVVCEAAGDRLQAISEQYRVVAHQLHPAAVRFGLLPALRSLAGHFPRPARCELAIDPAAEAAAKALAPEAVLAAYRIAEVALDNVARHAGADHVELALDGALQLSIRDDGRGFDPAGRPWGLGLMTVEGRAALAGWPWGLESSPGAGTRLWVRLDPGPHPP